MPREGSGAAYGILPARATVLLGALVCALAVAPVKLGNPAASTQQPVCPVDTVGWIRGPWPSETAVLFGILLGVSALGLGLVRRRVCVPSAPLSLFLAFVAWEFVCGTFAESRPAFLAAVRYHLSLAGFWYGAEVAGAGATERRCLLAASLCSLVYVGLHGLQQRWWEIEATRQYAFLYEAELFGPEGMPESLRSKLSSNRVWGTFVYPNVLAAFLVTVLPGSCVLAWVILRRRGPRVALPAGVLAGAIGSLALLYTGSKAGLACGLLAWGWAAAAWAGSRALRRACALVTAAVMAAAIGTALFVPRDRLQAGAATLASRGEYWRAALRLVAEHPIVGIGPGAFNIGYLRVKEADAEEAVYAHSMPFQTAAESGVPGGILWTAALAAGWVRLMGKVGAGPRGGGADQPRACSDREERLLIAAMTGGVGACFLHAWFDFAWEVPGVAVPAVVFLAQGTGERHVTVRVRWLRIAGPALLALIVLGAAGSSAARIRVETARAAEYSLRRSHPEVALAAGREATRIGPAIPLAWESRARAAEAANRLEEAAEAYRRAGELEPTRARYQYHYGRLAAAIPGREIEAQEALDRAAALYPTNPEYRPAAAKRTTLEHVP